MTAIDFTAFVDELALVSGETIRPFFRSALSVENKSRSGGFDPVTAADRAAEAAMRALIKRTFPAHGIVGEEFPADQPDAEWKTKLSAEAYVPLDHALQVKEGQLVEIQPRLTIGRRGEPLSIEKKRFRGKITFVDPQIQPVAETAVRIRAEFDNPGELRPGMMVQMTIFLNSEVSASALGEAVPTQTARNR